jgi:hypothetical protein
MFFAVGALLIIPINDLPQFPVKHRSNDLI